jgi:hypothetical protein
MGPQSKLQLRAIKRVKRMIFAQQNIALKHKITLSALRTDAVFYIDHGGLCLHRSEDVLQMITIVVCKSRVIRFDRWREAQPLVAALALTAIRYRNRFLRSLRLMVVIEDAAQAS